MREQESENQFQFFLSEFNTRIRDLEERNRVLRERVLILGNNVIQTKEDLEEELKNLKRENIEIKSLLRDLKRVSENLTIQSDKFIKKEEMYPIQRMLKDFQPLEFLRKKDVEKLIEERLLIKK